MQSVRARAPATRAADSPLILAETTAARRVDADDSLADTGNSISVV